MINHHQDVPFRVLGRKYSFDENEQTDAATGGENMIIRGNDLEALKALSPRDEGRVKCIYIDPPYNTGKEGEDLARHDKWLCMMYPRLKLLADDGATVLSC